MYVGGVRSTQPDWLPLKSPYSCALGRLSKSVAGEALGSVSPDAVLHWRREGILIKRSEVEAQTLASRKRYNHLLKESYNTAISP